MSNLDDRDDDADDAADDVARDDDVDGDGDFVHLVITAPVFSAPQSQFVLAETFKHNNDDDDDDNDDDDDDTDIC